MISISNCPITGLERKVDYEFFWYKKSRQIIIKCYVDYYKDGVLATENITRLKSYIKPLIASDTLVNPQTGTIMTQQQIADYHTATNILNAYNLETQMYNTAMTTYNAALTQYNTDYAAFELALADYNTAMEQYEIDVEEYNAAMLLNPPNPSNLPMPVMPIGPNQPTAPIEPVAPITPNPMPVPGPAPIQEYDFYAYVLGIQPLILPTLIENIILARDAEGKFNI